jgi:hypothetical protein
VAHLQERYNPILDRLADRLAHAEALRDGGGDQPCLANRGQRHEPDLVGEISHYLLSHPDRQARLANAPRAGEGHEAHTWTTKQVEDRCDFSLAADE